jgi:hypothetical protein
VIFIFCLETADPHNYKKLYFSMRFNILLAVVVLVLGYVTCKNFQKTKNTEPTPTVTAPTPEPRSEGPSGWKVAGVSGSNEDAAPTLQTRRVPRHVTVPMERLTTPPTTSRRAYLSSGYWRFEMAYVGSDTLVHLNYQPKVLQFEAEQKFNVLTKNAADNTWKVVDKGTWHWDEVKSEIYLACADPYINNTWKVQEKGFVMVWLGNTDVNVTGIQVRVAASRTLPGQ